MTRILLVVRSSEGAQSLVAALDRAGLQVEVAHNADAALDRLWGGRGIDLIAADSALPGGDGHALCRRVKADLETCVLPVVLFTSLSDPTELIEALASGADSFVTKPVDPDKLVQRVLAVLETERLRAAGCDPSITSDGLVSFQFQGRAFSAPTDPGRLVNYFVAALEDFLSARAAERQRAVNEAVLRDSVRLQKSTVDALPIGIALMDSSGVVLSVNAAWQRAGDANAFCGPTHCVGSSYLETLDAVEGESVGVAAQLTRGLRSIIDGSRPKFELEYPVYVRTGAQERSERWFHFQLSRFEDAGEVRFVAAHEEVTSRHRAEDELRETNRRLVAALDELKAAQTTVVAQERLRAVGQMASGIAHDFNNALAPILGYSEQLLLQPRVRLDDAMLTKRLKLIMTSAQDAASVVGRLREFARPSESSQTFVAVDLVELVESVIELTRPRWKHESEARGVAVAVRMQFQDVPAVLGDKSELREVLTNLVFNALDAMPTGGDLTFALRRVDERVVLEVRDQGHGMTPEQQAHCLEPFFTTKGEHGTGLGLAMVYGIVQRHGGEFEVQSKENVGTTCVLSLPALVGDITRPEEPSHTDEVSPMRVLVVDDQPRILDVVAAFLAIEGHTVTTAESGDRALQLFEPGAFDLVITDRAMPGMNGDQLGAELKRQDPSLPVLMLTGFGHLIEASGEQIPAIDRVLSKPVTRADLMDAVRQLGNSVPEPLS